MIDLNFWTKVNLNGPIVKPELGPCWLFERNIDKGGYAHFSKWDKNIGRARRHLAHRYAYNQFFGKFPPFLDHLCKTRNCINPWHLDDVSKAVNIARGDSPSAKHARQTVCKRGHELSQRSDNPNWRYCKMCLRLRYRGLI